MSLAAPSLKHATPRVDDESEELIFAFDEQTDGFTSLASFETLASDNPRRITFGGAVLERRPPNPVAGLLHSDTDDDDEDDDELREYCPKPLRSVSAPPPRHECGQTPPPASDTLLYACSRADVCDARDRRKRKCMDDTVVGMTCRIRPLAKRAKSFAFGRDASALKHDFAAMAPATSASRSDSITIPRSVALRSALSSRARGRSSSSGAPSDSGLAHSHSSSPSWNAPAASLEYFCRRSLDVSSPLRLRFRDLMVGSVGRATSYTGP